MVTDGPLLKTNQAVKKQEVGYDDKYRHVECSGERQVKFSIFFRTVKKRKTCFHVSKIVLHTKRRKRVLNLKEVFYQYSCSLSAFHAFDNARRNCC